MSFEKETGSAGEQPVSDKMTHYTQVQKRVTKRQGLELSFSFWLIITSALYMWFWDMASKNPIG